MPNLDIFLDMVAEKLDNENGEAWYSSIGMTYAYGQVSLHSLRQNTAIFKLLEANPLEQTDL